MATFEVLKYLTKCHMNEEETAVFVAKVTMREKPNSTTWACASSRMRAPYLATLAPYLAQPAQPWALTTGNTGIASGGATVGTP
jgi:hypothetical protein